MAKLTYTEIAADLRDTSDVVLKRKGSYAYVTGTYESILANLVADLPKHKQMEVMRLLQGVRERMQESA